MLINDMIIFIDQRKRSRGEKWFKILKLK